MAVEHADVVVVGSGFGGSVAAQRLAAGGRRVVLLERGRAYPPGSFARSPREVSRNFWDPAAGMHGLFHLWSFDGLDALVSAGLGGGSLIYANVLLRKDERWFVHDQPHPGPDPDHPGGRRGVEHWPITRDDLDPHYDRVERMLGATPFPYRDHPKTVAMQQAAAALEHDWQLPNLAISFADAHGVPTPGAPVPDPGYPNLHGLPRRTCRLCGECDIGCNDGAKNTLDHTYLSAAVADGAEIRTRCEVRRVRPRDGGGHAVEYVRWGPQHEGVEVDADELPHDTITCDRLVLAAGALGTPYLLLRNRSVLPGLGDALGTAFCGNGDLLTLAMRATHPDGTPRRLDAAHSPVITSTIRVPDELDGGEGRGFYLQDAGFPQFVEWLVEAAITPDTVGRYAGFAWERLRDRLTDDPDTDLSEEFARVLGDGTLSATSMPLLGMGRDVPDGRMSLEDGNLAVDWSTDTSMAFFERVRGVMEDVAGELGADFRDNLLWAFKRVITVHPLGGAPMGRGPEEGVVDEFGEAFGHPGLHVVDGAAMPGPVGPNPALTIAAFADRAAERILEADERVVPRAAERARTRPGSDRPAPGPVDAEDTTDEQVDASDEATGGATEERPATSLSFTEEMKGYVTLDDVEFEQGARRGREDDTFLMFRLTITLEDVEAFVRDPDHPGQASGWVMCDALGGRLEVERGWFNLFVRSDEPGEQPDTKQMLYRLWFADTVGNPLTLTGFKTIHDDPGFDTWSDTSTLYVRVLRGHVPPDGDGPSGHDAPVVASGVITIHLADFIEQLTTFRVRGPTVGGLLDATAAFGRLFLGELWDTYGTRITASLRQDTP